MSLPCRVLIVDDHPVVRLGLRLTFKDAEGFLLCGEAESADAARKAAEELEPDAIVLDLTMGGRDGLDLVEDLIAINEKVLIVVYTGMAEAHYAKRALRAGARGYLAKKAEPSMALEALKTILRGDLAVSEAVRRELLEPEAPADGNADLVDSLSNREIQVFSLIGNGLASARVADDLSLSIKTVGTYRERIKCKLGLRTAADLETAAREFVAKTDPHFSRSG